MKISISDCINLPNLGQTIFFCICMLRDDRKVKYKKTIKEPKRKFKRSGKKGRSASIQKQRVKIQETKEKKRKEKNHEVIRRIIKEGFDFHNGDFLKDCQPLWTNPFLIPFFETLLGSKRHLFAHNLQFFNC